MIHVNTLLVELLMYGIVYLVLLSLVSKIDSTTFGRTKIYDYQAEIHRTGNRSEVVF